MVENFLYVWDCETVNCNEIQKMLDITPNRHVSLIYRIEESRNPLFETEELYDFFRVYGESDVQINRKVNEAVKIIVKIIRYEQTITEFEANIQLSKYNLKKESSLIEFIYMTEQNHLKYQTQGKNYEDLKKLIDFFKESNSEKKADVVKKNDERLSNDILRLKNELNILQVKQNNRRWAIDLLIAIGSFFFGYFIH